MVTLDDFGARLARTGVELNVADFVRGATFQAWGAENGVVLEDNVLVRAL